MSIIKLAGKNTKTSPKDAETVIEAGRRVMKTEIEGLQALEQSLGQHFAEAVEMIFSVTDAASAASRGKIPGRVIVTGMGKPGHIGRKIAATLSSTGTPAFFIHPAEASHGDMGMITRGDIVLALSNSGETREMLDIVEYTRRFAVPLISITSNPESTLAQKSDTTLLLPRAPEACPNGLAPTTSSTMKLVIGDALAIALLEKKGFTSSDYKILHPGGKLGQQLMAVVDIMHTGEELPVADENITVAEAVEIITKKGFGCIALTGPDGKLTGLIADGDLRRHLSGDLLKRTAKDVMTKNPKTANHDMLVAEAMAIMNDIKGTFRKITVLIVVDETNTPVGLLHLHDCLRAGFA
jgi:arabinose-5-phosphate isomerase